MSQIDELVKNLIHANLIRPSKLGLDEARQVYENIGANPELNPNDLEPYFELFDSPAQRLLSHLFDPRYENLRASSQMTTKPPLDAKAPITASPLQDMDINASNIEQLPMEMTLEATSLSQSLLIQAIIGGNANEGISTQMLSAVEAFEAYNNQLGRYQDSNKLDDLIAAANFLAKTASALAGIQPRDPVMLSAQQSVQYSFYEQVVGICEQAKEHPDFQEAGEHILGVLRIKTGAKINMKALDDLRAENKGKGGNGSNGSAAPESGPAPLGGSGLGPGIAAASIPFQTALYAPHLAQSIGMASTLSLARLALPVF